MDPFTVIITASYLYEDGSHTGNTYQLPGSWKPPSEFGEPIQSLFFPSMPPGGEARKAIEKLGGLVEDYDNG